MAAYTAWIPILGEPEGEARYEANNPAEAAEKCAHHYHHNRNGWESRADRWPVTIHVREAAASGGRAYAVEVERRIEPVFEAGEERLL